jgi:transposase-like protein
MANSDIYVKTPNAHAKYLLNLILKKLMTQKLKKRYLSFTVNGNGTRATARILGISKDTVTSTLKK